MSRREVDTGSPAGARLRQIRKDAAKTQAEMAALFGVSQASITDVERGRSKPSAEIVAGVERLGYSGLWLVTGEGDMRAGLQLVERAAEPVVGYDAGLDVAGEISKIEEEMANLSARLGCLKAQLERKKEA